MRRALRAGIPLLAAAALVCARGAEAPSSGTPAVALPDSGAEILWDDWGAAHVYAADDEALFHAFGWAQAEARGSLLLRLYGQARGRAAEYWGADWLRSDRRVRTFGIPGRAEEWYREQTPDEKRWLDAFAAGINDWASRHADAIPDSLKVVLPVTGADPLAEIQWLVHFGFLLEPWDEAGQAAAEAGRPALGPPASNGWAIGPSHSADGHAMLLVNPHLPWVGPFTLFEAQLAGPGIDFSGAAFVGLPFPAFGFNDRLGWTHTVNPMDGADLYELTPAGDGYRWDGGTRAFDTEVDTLLVRESGGLFRRDTLVVRRSVQGPVIAEKGGHLYALRVTGLDQPHVLGQYWDMARARNRKEFEAALSRLQLPFFNVIYADRDGHVLYVFGGRVPDRPYGDWDFWTKAVPGDTSATLWTKTLPYDRLPRVLDPPSGWVQNANDPPWTSTWPPALHRSDYPAWLSGTGTGFRAQRSIEMLRAAKKISFDEMVADKHSTRSALADRILDELLGYADHSDVPQVKAAARILHGWDRSFDADSRGAMLFLAWVREMIPRVKGFDRIFARPFDPERPLETPAGIGDSAWALDALAEAVQTVAELYGRPDVAWGEVERLRADSVDLPANGAPDPLGAFRVTRFARTDPTGRTLRAIYGDSWVAAVEFGDSLRAEGLLSYGNADDPALGGTDAQLKLYSEKRLRPIRRSRADVEAHLTRRERL